MKTIIQFGIALVCALGTAFCLYSMVMDELNFQDPGFGKYFGVLGVLAFISFIVLTQNDDNEETNPAKEKVKK